MISLINSAHLQLQSGIDTSFSYTLGLGQFIFCKQKLQLSQDFIDIKWQLLMRRKHMELDVININWTWCQSSISWEGYSHDRLHNYVLCE